MISEDVICTIKKHKFYKAVDEVNLNSGFPPLLVFYSFIIYFRYKSFIKCVKSQEERDSAYVSFYKVKGTMWFGIILGLFFIFVMGSLMLNASKI
jgi:hypothetical protein